MKGLTMLRPTWIHFHGCGVVVVMVLLHSTVVDGSERQRDRPENQAPWQVQGTVPILQFTSADEGLSWHMEPHVAESASPPSHAPAPVLHARDQVDKTPVSPISRETRLLTPGRRTRSAVGLPVVGGNAGAGTVAPQDSAEDAILCSRGDHPQSQGTDEASGIEGASLPSPFFPRSWRLRMRRIQTTSESSGMPNLSLEQRPDALGVEYWPGPFDTRSRCRDGLIHRPPFRPADWTDSWRNPNLRGFQSMHRHTSGGAMYKLCPSELRFKDYILSLLRLDPGRARATVLQRVKEEVSAGRHGCLFPRFTIPEELVGDEVVSLFTLAGRVAQRRSEKRVLWGGHEVPPSVVESLITRAAGSAPFWKPNRNTRRSLSNPL